MQFTASIGEFQKLLQKTLPAVPPKSTLPVLEHLHFALSGNELSVVASDQEITIMSKINVTGSADGSVLVPGRRLSEIVKALGSEGNIDFFSDEAKSDIKLQTTFGKYNMKGLDAEEYLDIPELFKSKPEYNIDTSHETTPSGASFTKDEIVRLAQSSGFAVATDEYRPAMTGMLFQFRGTYINAVSTDSFRLVKAVCKPENASYPVDTDVIIPSRTTELMKKIDADSVFSFVKSQGKLTHIRIEYGNTMLVSRLINEKFPPYETVIPTDSKVKAYADCREVLSAIRRVSIFSNAISKQIRMAFDSEQITIIGEDEDSGTLADEKIPCEFAGDRVQIGFNYKFLEEALHHIDADTEDKRVVFNFSDPNRPIIIKPDNDKENLLMLIMPVRISSSSTYNDED
ncbi:MAG: Beta sliding clamp [Ignavibacteria bacterium]|nr:Beta sliding clamp [Ignavibacteria bacterium]